jgi:hypothetical protein
MNQVEVFRMNTGANMANMVMAAPTSAIMATMVTAAPTSANMANIAIGVSTPEAPRTVWSFYAEAWARDQGIRDQEERLFQRIKELSMSRIEEARVLARQAINTFQYSRRIKRISELLEPPQVRVNLSSNPSREKEFEWIRQNQSKYMGQWTALCNDKCLAIDKSFVRARDKAREIVGSGVNFLLVYFPKQND